MGTQLLIACSSYTAIVLVLLSALAVTILQSISTFDHNNSNTSSMESEKKPLKVGPFGSDSGGDRFDDGVHTAVRQVVICYAPSSIRYIQIEYDDNGKSYWSPKHGYSSSLSLDKIETIKLDYPDEYLTSIHGYYKSTWYLPTYVSSLTFTSNRKVYGPYGDYENEGRKYFTIQVSGSKIVGFHGRSDDWFDLRALGAYLKPVVHIQQYSNNTNPAPVAHIGYPAVYNFAPPVPRPPPYYGNNYYNNPNQPPQAAPPADPTPYQYGNYYVPPPGPPPPYNYGYYDYQMSQAPPLPPPAALGRPSKPKSSPSKPKAANGPKNVSYRVLDNQVSGNTGDRNGLFNVGNKNTGRHMDDDDEDEEW
ncbi:uncharacterized protein LOC126790267 [Argentina anserina]|uniref:uncharacterized protein LOC126790267 n=1 Tax=Argentina anserina TaxID=57926 RepID=UPI0021767B17|nr:uncharacterized protein LOC126790267 [Potentilla anserina]